MESDLRCKLYKEIDTLRNGFNDLVTNFNKPKLEEIVDFISSEGRRCASNTVTQIKEVPAVLVTGDDHILHEQDHGILRRALNILDSMIVACIVEPDNYLSVESLTKSIVKDIIKDWRLKSGRRKKGPKITEELSEALPYTLGTVRRLYTKHSSTVGAFVVFISGLTTTSIPIIGSFISICREYISDIPIVLVFGVATCIETFYNYIPHSAISSLKVKEIQLKSSDEFVDALVEEVMWGKV